MTKYLVHPVASKARFKTIDMSHPELYSREAFSNSFPSPKTSGKKVQKSEALNIFPC